MKRLYIFLAVFVLVLLHSTQSFAFLGNSLRIRALGDELSGIVTDEYTDIYRNPAYLYSIKNLRVFGQSNTYGYTELEIATFMNNEGAILGGIVIPLSRYGTWALVGELEPSSDEVSWPLLESREDYLGHYAITTRSSGESRDNTIRNFKTVYSLQVNPNFIVGVDFTYLKNYNYVDSNSTQLISDFSLPGDSLRYTTTYSSTGIFSSSPDAQRFTLGAIFFPRARWSLDLSLYYEHLGYTFRDYTVLEGISTFLYPDTVINAHVHDFNMPIRGKAYGLEYNLRFRYSTDMVFRQLFEMRYQKKTNLGSELSTELGYNSSVSWLWFSEDKSSFSDNNEYKSLSFLLGSGLEKDFSPSVKIGLGAKGYWEKIDTRRSESQSTQHREVFNDSTIAFSTDSSKSDDQRTSSIFRLALPIGLEAKLLPILKVRISGTWEYEYDSSMEGHVSYSSSYYGLGLGFSLEGRICLDAYVQDPIQELKSWMVNVGYNF